VTADRRHVLRVALGGGALGALVLPESWTRPVVKSVVVPAHAQASPRATTTTTTTTTTTHHHDDHVDHPASTLTRRLQAA
jgi:hypothetical protein